MSDILNQFLKPLIDLNVGNKHKTQVYNVLHICASFPL